MRKKLFALLGGLFVATTLFFTACENDPCGDKDKCGAHGACNAGVCDCEAGYEIDPGNGRCDLITREKFSGTYSLSETCTFADGTTGNAKYDVIVSDTLDTGVTADLGVVGINGLGGYGCKDAGTNKELIYHVRAKVAKNAITIESGTIACNTDFVGEGTYDATTKTITLNYTATYTDGTGKKNNDVCKAVLTKK